MDLFSFRMNGILAAVTLALSASTSAAPATFFILAPNGKAVVGRSDVVCMGVDHPSPGRHVVSIRLKPAAHRRFSRMSAKNVGRQIVFRLCGKKSDPITIQAEISEKLPLHFAANDAQLKCLQTIAGTFSSGCK